ncbi:MAG: RluA family pseudouridine synthase [Candidatus Gastranaerophilales bacterium]|nr:RluA family pseudouridine synthase [Candidatus Gastranaerophilales bacterium]
MTGEFFIKQEVELEDVSKRLDIYLSEILPEFSRSRIQTLIKDSSSITVNSQSSKNSYKLKLGDIITIRMPEAKELNLKAQDLNLDIIYENDDLLVVNKPFGMLTHPTGMESENTLVNGLLYHCRENLSGINGILRPGIVHRLDKDTSGLLMVAKNDFAHGHLSGQIKEKTAVRKYLTIVHGNLKEDEGTIDLPIDRHRSEKCKMAVDEKGKNAITMYKVLERFGDYTFVEAALRTGRTHQIRVHFSYLKYPLYGDKLYGGSSVKVKTTGQVLQSYSLKFINPKDNKELSFEIPPDEDLTKVLKYLRSRKQ